MSEVKELRRLAIKSYHITNVEKSVENKIQVDGNMYINEEVLQTILPKYPKLETLNIEVIRPGDRERYTNTIMDIIPISTKVLGKIGEGITHTLTGVYVLLTGVDVNG